jgi:undecaprenyl-diphosphatase
MTVPAIPDCIMIHDALVEWDRSVFRTLNAGLKCETFDRVMPALTHLGLGHVQALIAVAVALVLAARSRNALSGLIGQGAWLLPLLLGIALSGLASTALKVIPRDRPWWYYEKQAGPILRLDSATRVRTVPGVYPLKVRGFPSGHTATSAAAATVLAVLFARSRRGGWLVAGAWMLAALIGISRIYLASHWPLDVIGGALLGAACGLFSIWVCRRAGRRRAGSAEPARNEE